MTNLPNLLIVDDKLENLIFLKSVIKKIEVNLIQAFSGYEALEKTKGIELALAIIDVQMPGMNGDELAVKLNEQRQGTKIPIMFLTANYFNETEVVKGYVSGAVDYIFKPIDSHILISKINVFLDLFLQRQIIVRNSEELKASAEQLQQLAQYIEKVRENERLTISRELHDDLGQALTAVKIDLGMIKQDLTDKDIIVKINKVSSLVSETIKTVQRLTAQLRPDIIDDLGIVAAIEWYTKEFSQRNGLEVKLNLDIGISIPPDISLIIFRVMQESLTNISRHSKASKVDIMLNMSLDNINLMVIDNGIGIVESEIKSKKSFGIISMKERAKSVGGSFEIYPGKKGGTYIKLILPLKI